MNAKIAKYRQEIKILTKYGFDILAVFSNLIVSLLCPVVFCTCIFEILEYLQPALQGRHNMLASLWNPGAAHHLRALAGEHRGLLRPRGQVRLRHQGPRGDEQPLPAA